MPTLARACASCPHPDCPANRGEAEQHVVSHASFRTKAGPRRRRLCRVCGRTFSARTGTAYERLRSPRTELERAVQMLAEGMTKAAIARTVGRAPSTIGRWLDRAAQHARAFHDAHVKLVDAQEIQVDEVAAKGVGEARDAWAFSAVEVESRFWLGLHVARRTLRNTLRFVRSVRAALGETHDWILVGSDRFKYYAPAMKRVFEGDPVVYHQVHNRYSRGRVVRSESKLVMGPPEAYAHARLRDSDSRRPNTSFIERLNLNQRMCCAMLRRRTPAPARAIESLQGSLELVRTVYNFTRFHSSLRSLRGRLTPAMAAGIVRKPLRIRDILAWVVPGGLTRRRTLRAVLDRC